MPHTFKTLLVPLTFGLLCASFITSPAVFAESEPISRTETNCNFGMVKGEAGGNCQVPIPSGCTVAQFPGYDQPWTNISKGGGTTCRFDEGQTDWKTTIVGTCEKCTTDQCSARFSVMFNCSENNPPIKFQAPVR